MENGYKFKCEMSVTMGSYIFGLISAVVNALGMLNFIVILSQWNQWMSIDPEDYVIVQAQIYWTLIYMSIVAVLFVVTVVDFTFCVLLLHGIRKNVAGFVRAYLIYGIVKTVLGLLAVLVLVFSYVLPVHALILLVVCGVYSLILLMVHKTHQKMTARNIYTQFDNNQLSLPNKTINC